MNPAPAVVVREAMARARRLRDADLSTWTARCAGLCIRLRYTNAEVGERLARRMVGVTREHAGAVDLTFDFLEADVLGWPAPSSWPLWNQDRIALQRQLAGEQIGALVPEQALEPDFPVMFFDPRASHGVILVQGSMDLPGWVSGAPFAFLFHLALAARGDRLLHAGTLANDTHGAIIIGPQGAGKSATTLSGVCAGLKTVGDDYVAVEMRDRPVAWPVYTKFKQYPAGLDRFSSLQQRVSHLPLNWNGKVEFDADLVDPSCWAPRLDLKAILIPEIANLDRTEVVEVAPTAAFSLMAHALMPQLPGARMAGFSFLTRLTRALPGYCLRLSNDSEEVGARVRSLLDNLS
jgi:hypothetical protein